MAHTSHLSSQDFDPTPWLKPHVGTWDVELKLFVGGEGSEPVVFQGSEVGEALGNRWIITRFEAEFGGQPFHGRGMFGYDARKEHFVSVWVDSVNGYMSQFEGALDPDNDVVVLVGKQLDPNTGDLVDGKQVYSLREDGTRWIQNFQKLPGDGEFAKVTELTFRREPD